MCIFTGGRPSSDRTWTECFAQLVGTVLSLWDAGQLDAAGEDGEVVPSFINLGDASIKMIESLPMNGQDGQTLQNVLSISTAANNRYLLHFNSLNSLTQWTAGIRLAMFEHAALQESYTGSIIAGKGRHLNNIRAIMDKTKFKHEDWARVRFGAGTPWRRCWCVIEPPDEKEVSKAHKADKKNPYAKPQKIKGDIKFYVSNKIKKKSVPIATITDAYSAYAIYPQAKPLIDQSTLVKLEGRIKIHTSPSSASSETEGFVFIMPEVHPMVSGFEMLLRFLFPVWDIFHLYGRPNRLIADPIDSRGLMFALPTDRRYGYLEILDVAGLIHTKGSGQWSEYRWRKEMKDLTSQRMDIPFDQRPENRPSTEGKRKRLSRSSLPGSRGGVRFGDETPTFSEPPSGNASPVRQEGIERGRAGGSPTKGSHRRSLSEQLNRFRHTRGDSTELQYQPLSAESLNKAPQPPPHMDIAGKPALLSPPSYSSGGSGSGAVSPGGASPDSLEPAPADRLPEVGALVASSPPLKPVQEPPAFSHIPSSRPSMKLRKSPRGQRDAPGPMDDATMAQLVDVNRSAGGLNYAAAGASAAWNTNSGRNSRNGSSEDLSQGPQQHGSASPRYRPTQRSQLPTIPASPYVDQLVGAPQKLSYFEPAPSPLAENSNSETSSPAPSTPSGALLPGERPGYERQGSYGISRKPVGVVVPVMAQQQAPQPPAHGYPNGGGEQGRLYQNGGNGAVDPQKSVDAVDVVVSDAVETESEPGRRRAGVLRTVGQVEPIDHVVVGDTRYGVGGAEQRSIADGRHGMATATDGAGNADGSFVDAFNVNFGPTYDLTAGSTGLLGATSHGNVRSGGGARHGRGGSGAQMRDRSPLGMHDGVGLNDVAAEAPTAAKHGSSGSISWRPGMVSTPAVHQQQQQQQEHQGQHAMSAGEWVAQRSAQVEVQQRQHQHARNKSSLELLNRTTAGTPPLIGRTPPPPGTGLTPPPSVGRTPPRSPARTPDSGVGTRPGSGHRHSSGDWAAYVGRLVHQRSSSRELLAQATSNSRPGSRQNNTPTPPIEGRAASRLSGRDSPSPFAAPGGGLVGEIAAREAERDVVKEAGRESQRLHAQGAHQRYHSAVTNPAMQLQQQQQQQQWQGGYYNIQQQDPAAAMMNIHPAFRQQAVAASGYGVPYASAPVTTQRSQSPGFLQGQQAGYYPQQPLQHPQPAQQNSTAQDPMAYAALSSSQRYHQQQQGQLQQDDNARRMSMLSLQSAQQGQQQYHPGQQQGQYPQGQQQQYQDGYYYQQ